MEKVFSPYADIMFNRERIAEMIEERVKFSDSMFGDLFESIYQLTDELTTAWSCQGHPNEEVWNTPYIMFYCTGKGKALVEKAFDNFVKKITPQQVIATGLTVTMRLSPSYDGEIYDIKHNDIVKTLVWGSRSTFDSEKERQAYIDKFSESLINVLKFEKESKNES